VNKEDRPLGFPGMRGFVNHEDMRFPSEPPGSHEWDFVLQQAETTAPKPSPIDGMVHVPARPDFPETTLAECIAMLKLNNVPLYLRVPTSLGNLFITLDSVKLGALSKIAMDDPAQIVQLRQIAMPGELWGRLIVYYVEKRDALADQISELSGIHDIAEMGATRMPAQIDIVVQETEEDKDASDHAKI